MSACTCVYWRDVPGSVDECPVHSRKQPQYMENPAAVGAPKNSRWGYLPCGCSNDGYGRHAR